MLEGLESRRLLAAAVSVVAGKLTVTGTASADVVDISKAATGLTVTVDGVPKSITASVTSILMTGGKGDDKLTISDAVTIKATLQGDEGNDTLSGGKGADLIQGGAGNDTADYSSRAANLTIGIGTLADDGEAGEKDNVQTDIETVLGGSGNDKITGGGGNNLLVGNGGNDSLDGNYGNDTLSGNAGGDTLNGNGGSDTAINSAGDTLIGIETSPPSSGTASIVDRVLVVDGTEQADALVIARGASDVHTAGGQNFNGADFDSILVHGFGGSDTIDLHTALKPASIDGGEGNDTILGGGGDDSIDGGAGADLMKGGDGIDTVDYSTRTADLTVGIGTLADDGAAGEKDNVYVDIEVIVAGSGNDSITGSGANNTIRGGGGNDTIAAQLGDDFVSAGSGDDIVRGFGGNDTLNGGDGNDSIFGGKGADVINGQNNNDTLIGGDAPDDNTALPDNDLILGGSGDDSIFGGSDDDSITGGEGADTLDGGAGNDAISGEEDPDSITGDAGDDMLDGGPSADTIDGGTGIDSLSGGSGNDLLTDTGVTPIVDPGTDDPTDTVPGGEIPDDVPPLPPTVPRATLMGGSGDDTLMVDAGPALLSGDDGNDSLVGGTGDDLFYGGDGDDTLEGNGGIDVLNGGGGADSMSGGDENDIFVNNEGEADTMDGGPGFDIGQVEENLVDSFSNVESRYDQPPDTIIVDPGSGDGDLPIPENPIVDGSSLIVDVPLAATPAPTLVNGVLTVVGFTDAANVPINDNVQITQTASQITVNHNSQLTNFPTASVTSIVVDVGNGNDNVSLELANGTSSVTKPSVIVGGNGNDTLRGGSGADVIKGQGGTDRLLGAAGNDVLDGGSGNDYLLGGSTNTLTNDGTDVLKGGDGNADFADYDYRTDNLSLTLDGKANDGAETENDFIVSDVEDMLGGRGNDLMVGNQFVNYLAGGGGVDTLKGGTNDDILVANYTKDKKADFVFGNAGTDWYYMDDGAVDNYSVLNGDFFALGKDAAIDVKVADQA